MLERKLRDSITLEFSHVAADGLAAIDEAGGHHASGPDFEAGGCVEEFIQARGRRAHEALAYIIVVSVA